MTDNNSKKEAASLLRAIADELESNVVSAMAIQLHNVVGRDWGFFSREDLHRQAVASLLVSRQRSYRFSVSNQQPSTNLPYRSFSDGPLA